MNIDIKYNLIKKTINFFIYFSIVITVLSQFVNFSFIRPMMYISWMITLFIAFISNKGKIKISKFTKKFIFIYILFLIFCVSLGVLNSNYIESNYLRVLNIPLLVTIIVDLCKLEEKNIKKIKLLYVISAIVFALWVHSTYFSSYSSWLKQMVYTFTQKNSAAQIWGMALLILVFGINYKNKIIKILGYILATYLLFMIGISQCRTALLSLAIITILFALIKSKRKILFIFLLIIVIMITSNISFFRDFINQALFLTKYEGTDINTFSSGRIELYVEAFNNFLKSPIIGIGKYYVDCSYLLILTETGIIGFTLIETIWINKLWENFSLLKSNSYSNLIFSITIFYLVESLLEGFPPFGPGTSSFMFWFITEYCNKKAIENKEIK